MVPVKIIGKMTLNKNPENFFAETEQVAFLPGHIIPGIDFTNDPLLQGRLFSYRDTQLSRLGSPNFHQIPINKPVVPTHNNQRDGHMQMDIPKGQTAYFPNSLSGGCPHLAKMSEGAFTHYEERIDARKIRTRSESFSDHFSQPALFYRSLADWEKQHVTDAYIFELGKCMHQYIQERMLYVVAQIDEDLSQKVAKGLGLKVPKSVEEPLNQAIGADAEVAKFQPPKKKVYLEKDPALSQANTKFNSIETRQVAVLIGDGFSMADFNKMKDALEKEGAMIKVVAPHGGTVSSENGQDQKVDAAIATTESVLYDALYVPGGKDSVKALKGEAKFIKFINEALKHCKAIAGDHEGVELLETTYVSEFKDDAAICLNSEPSKFINAMKQHRNWKRMAQAKKIPV